jgi:hypothetical protein
LLMPHVEKQAHVCKLRRNAMVASFMVAGCELVSTWCFIRASCVTRHYYQQIMWRKNETSSNTSTSQKYVCLFTALYHFNCDTSTC